VTIRNSPRSRGCQAAAMGAKSMMTTPLPKDLAWAFPNCGSGALLGLERHVFYPI
jgi:hypothetical protein